VSCEGEIIKERTGLGVGKYLANLKRGIETHVNQKLIDQDLNTLLPNPQFQQIRKTLKQEVLMLLADEIKKW
jgi:hypothetical protein